MVVVVDLVRGNKVGKGTVDKEVGAIVCGGAGLRMWQGRSFGGVVGLLTEVLRAVPNLYVVLFQQGGGGVGCIYFDASRVFIFLRVADASSM